MQYACTDSKVYVYIHIHVQIQLYISFFTIYCIEVSEWQSVGVFLYSK